jgi:hypothetical protein
MSKTQGFDSDSGHLPKNSAVLCGMAANGESFPSSRRSTEPLRVASRLILLARGTIVSKMEVSINSRLPRGGVSSSSISTIILTAAGCSCLKLGGFDLSLDSRLESKSRAQAEIDVL